MVQAWQVNGSTVAEMTDTADVPLSYTVQNVTTKTEVSATLIERPTYTITVTSEGSGTASAEPASVKRGGSTTITAVPSSNSSISRNGRLTAVLHRLHPAIRWH